MSCRQHPEVYLFVDRASGKTSVDRAPGKTNERPQLQKLFESAARREFQVVLVWALDRFVGENVAETFVNIQKLRRYGVQFVSFTEEHFRTTGPGGALMMPMAAWIVQQERVRISERTRPVIRRTRRCNRLD